MSTQMNMITTCPCPSCTIKLLPEDQWISAASQAREINPANGLATDLLAQTQPDEAEGSCLFSFC